MKYRGKKEEFGHGPTIDPCKTKTILEEVDIPLVFEVLPPVVMKNSIFWVVTPL
jgi:hypothetical protein